MRNVQAQIKHAKPDSLSPVQIGIKRIVVRYRERVRELVKERQCERETIIKPTFNSENSEMKSIKT